MQLWNNQLKGCLPSTWPNNLPAVQALKIWGNALKGSFPGSWDGWASLTSL